MAMNAADGSLTLNEGQKQYMSQIVNGMQGGRIDIVANALSGAVKDHVNIPEQFLATVKQWMDSRQQSAQASLQLGIANSGLGAAAPALAAASPSGTSHLPPGPAASGQTASPSSRLGSLGLGSLGAVTPFLQQPGKFDQLHRELEDAIRRQDTKEMSRILQQAAALAQRGGIGARGGATPAFSPGAMAQQQGGATPLLATGLGTAATATSASTVTGAATPLLAGLTPPGPGITPPFPFGTPPMPMGKQEIKQQLLASLSMPGASVSMPVQTLRSPSSGPYASLLQSGGLRSPTSVPTEFEAKQSISEVPASIPHGRTGSRPSKVKRRSTAPAPAPAKAPQRQEVPPLSPPPSPTIDLADEDLPEIPELPTPDGGLPSPMGAAETKDDIATPTAGRQKERRQKKDKRAVKPPPAKDSRPPPPPERPQKHLPDNREPTVDEIADFLRGNAEEDEGTFRQICLYFVPNPSSEYVRRTVEAEPKLFVVNGDVVRLLDPRKDQALKALALELVKPPFRRRKITPDEACESLRTAARLASQAKPERVVDVFLTVAKKTMRRIGKHQAGTWPANMPVALACIIDMVMTHVRTKGKKRWKKFEHAFGPTVGTIIFERWVLGVVPGSQFLANLLIKWEAAGYFKSKHLEPCRKPLGLLLAYARKEGVPDPDKEPLAGWYKVVERDLKEDPAPADSLVDEIRVPASAVPPTSPSPSPIASVPPKLPGDDDKEKVLSISTVLSPGMGEEVSMSPPVAPSSTVTSGGVLSPVLHTNVASAGTPTGSEAAPATGRATDSVGILTSDSQAATPASVAAVGSSAPTSAAVAGSSAAAQVGGTSRAASSTLLDVGSAVAPAVSVSSIGERSRGSLDAPMPAAVTGGGLSGVVSPAFSDGGVVSPGSSQNELNSPIFASPSFVSPPLGSTMSPSKAGSADPGAATPTVYSASGMGPPAPPPASVRSSSGTGTVMGPPAPPSAEVRSLPQAAGDEDQPMAKRPRTEQSK